MIDCVYKVLETRKKLSEKPPLLIKISPDLTTEGMQDIAAVVTRGKVSLTIMVQTLTDEFLY